MNIVDKVIQTAGGAKTLAEAIGDISDKAVYEWRYRGTVPAARVIQIEKITGIPRYELRPDMYPKEVA